MKKNIHILFILSFFLIISISLGTVTRADLKLSTDDNITDPANDLIVIDYNTTSWEYTDLHTELDINTMIRINQNFTITFHSTIHTEVYYNYEFYIYELTESSETNYRVRLYGANTGYLEGPAGYWTSTGWSFSNTPIRVGTISGDKVEIGIPSDALTLQSSHN
ncbi:MAG: hypothetical protein ACFFDH_00925 [Promethearchaeota archaeon]